MVRTSSLCHRTRRSWGGAAPDLVLRDLSMRVQTVWDDIGRLLERITDLDTGNEAVESDDGVGGRG